MLLGNTTGAQLEKTFNVFQGTRRFIAVIRRARL
jgi:hypothetical protein